MPWNDLYGLARQLSPGSFYPPIEVGVPVRRRRGFTLTPCRNSVRSYLKSGPFGAFVTLLRLAARNRRRRQNLLVHVHNPSLALIAVLARIFSPNLRIVGNLHNDWPHFNRKQKSSLWLLGRTSAAFITVSEALVSNIPLGLRVSLRKRNALFSIRNGIPSEEFDNAYPVDGMKRRNRDVVVVARMVPQKNVEMILEVFSQLRHADRLIWFGDGPQRADVVELIEQYGIKHRVVLKGIQPRVEVLAALANSSAYLACSRWEGIGVANMEAAAMGCFPFLSKISPHEEIGRLLSISTFPLGGIVQWVDALDAWLAQDEVARMEKAKRLAITAREKCNLVTAVELYLQVYRSLNNENKRAI
jgi:glycosyltransferase involved in cell wall biosynthesis